MNEPKWTPGPRRVEPAPSFAHSPRVFGGPDGKTLIAEFGNMEGDTERHHADAVLDAAAPDLFEALDTLTIALSMKHKGDDIAAYQAMKSIGWERAFAALAKARGETP